MYTKFGQFIDGKWQAAEKNETYEVINPATEEIIGNASKASKIDVFKYLSLFFVGRKSFYFYGALFPPFSHF